MAGEVIKKVCPCMLCGVLADGETSYEYHNTAKRHGDNKERLYAPATKTIIACTS